MGDGPIVLITGASGGIGAAVSLAYAELGGRLALLGRSPGRLTKLAGQCRERGGEALVITADVADAKAVREAVEHTVGEYGGLDIVVHSAASLAYGKITEVPEHVWDHVLDVDIKGTSNIARETLKVFERQARGNLVIIGSVLGDITAPNMGSYATSKWAVHGLARVLQQDTRNQPRVHVSVVAPGGIDTSIYQDAATYIGRPGSPPPPVLRPEAVAKKVLKVVDSHKRKVDAGPFNWIMRLGFQFAPRIYDALVGPLFSRLALGRKHVAPTEGNVFTPSEQLTHE